MTAAPPGPVTVTPPDAVTAAPTDAGGPDQAGEVVRRLTDAGRTVAVAESLTGGAVVEALVRVPGASACLRGGVVAYATDLKAGLLGVPQALLDERGPIDPDVARAMADGVRVRLGADYGVATTGVAGPDAQGGRPPGTFHVAVVGPTGVVVRSGDVGPVGRTGVRAAARDASLALLLERVTSDTEERVTSDTEGTPRDRPALNSS